MFLAWQTSDEQLQQAMQTIDQMAANVEPTDRQALLKAKQFYEHLLEQECPPGRVALVHYRLGKINERLGDHAAAEVSYQAAIARWEKMALDWPGDAAYLPHLKEGRERLQMLSARKLP
jgi:hypothetical protein